MDLETFSRHAGKCGLVLTLILLSLPVPGNPTVSTGNNNDPLSTVSGKRLSGLGVRVSTDKPVTLETRSAIYTLTRGTLFEAISDKGKPLGYYFEGSGTLRWKRSLSIISTGLKPREPDELERQLKKFLKWDSGSSDFIFTTALFLFAGQGAVQDSKFSLAPHEANSKDFLGFLKNADSPFLPPADIGLAAALGNTEKSYFAAILEGKRTLAHVEDGVFSGESSLAVLGRYTPPVILDSVRLTNNADFVLEQAEVDIRELERGERQALFRISQRITLLEKTRVLVFAILADPAPAFFDSVSEETLGELPFSLQRGRLLVLLPREFGPHSSLNLRMRYQGSLLPRMDRDRMGWELPGHLPWYPAPSRWEDTLALWSGVIRTKKPCFAVVAGEPVRRAVEGAWNLLEFRSERPLHALSVSVAYYLTQPVSPDPFAQLTDLVVWAAPPSAESEHLAMALPKLTLSTFPGQKGVDQTGVAAFAGRILLEAAALLGPYPLSRLQLVEREGSVDSMSAQNWGLNSGDVLPVARGQSVSNAVRLAQRLLEGYWSTGLRPRKRQDSWLTIGLAYGTALEIFESSIREPGTGPFLDEALSRAQKVLSDSRAITARVLAAASNPEEKDAMTPLIRSYLVFGTDAPEGLNAPSVPLLRGHAISAHNKGPILFDALRSRLGPPKFRTFIKNFRDERLAEGEMGALDLLDALNRTTGEDWSLWFEKYVFGNELPPKPVKQ